MPRNNRSTTAPRGSGGGGGSLVYNPFKPQRNLWIRYVTLLLLALGLTWMVILFRSTTTTKNSAVTLDTSSSYAAVDDRKNDDTNDDNNNNGNDDELPEDDTVLSSQEDADEDENEEEDEDDVEEFPHHLPLDQFPAWIHKYLNKLDWPAIHKEEEDDDEDDNGLWLTRDILLESLTLGCDNLQTNQLEIGNFNYQYDFVQRTFDPTDSEVRQAGALWGLSLCYQYYNGAKYKAAIEKGLQFFMNLTVPGPQEGTLVVRYPDAHALQSATGTNALFGLAMLEYLQTTSANDDNYFVKEVQEVLHKIIAHLVHAQLVSPNSPHFAQAYYFGSQTFAQSSSPYFDGEVLLCLTKAAKYYNDHVASSEVVGFRTVTLRIIGVVVVVSSFCFLGLLEGGVGDFFGVVVSVSSSSSPLDVS